MRGISHSDQSAKVPLIENPVLQRQHAVRFAASLPQVAQCDPGQNLVVETLLHKYINVGLGVSWRLVSLDRLWKSLHQAPEDTAVGVCVCEIRSTLVCFHGKQAWREGLINVRNSKQGCILNVDVYRLVSTKRLLQNRSMAYCLLQLRVGDLAIPWRPFVAFLCAQYCGHRPHQ